MKKLYLAILLLVACACGGNKEDIPSSSYLRVMDTGGNALSVLQANQEGLSVDLKVEATGLWKASSDADWIRVSPSTGNKYSKLSLSVIANRTGTSRSGKVSVMMDGLDPVSIAVNQEAGGSTDETLRVMTFNIRAGGKSDGSTDAEGHEWSTVRKGPVIDMFNDVFPDVAMLQECRQEQLEDLQDRLGAVYQFCFYAVNGILKSGKNPSCTENVFSQNGARQVIMLKKSVLEMADWGVFWLSETPDVISTSFSTDVYKITLWLKVRKKGENRFFYVFNTHFVTPSKGNVIKANATVNVEQIKKEVGDATVSGKGSPSVPVFFAGDLNCADDDASNRLAPVKEYMYYARTDAPATDPGMTYNGYQTSENWKRLDHIFYLGAKPDVYKVIQERKYGTDFISDHFPVYCDFTLSTP